MLISHNYRKLYLLLLLFPLVLSNNLHAAPRTVTHAGSAGLNTAFFMNTNTGGTNPSCSSCHNGTTAVNWGDYSEINDAYYTNAVFLARLNADPVTQAGIFMPQGGNTNVNTTMLTAWFSAGKHQYRSPYIAAGTHNAPPLRITTNNYSQNVLFTVNENGADATFTANYRIQGNVTWLNFSASNPAGSGGSGTVASDGESTAELTGLQCGTTYEYRLSGSNSGGTDSGPTNTFSITCNTGASLSGSPGNAIEDSAFTWTPTVTPGSGTDTLSFDFSVAPSATVEPLTINSSTGQVSWTPREGETSRSFTIRVSDAAADTNITHTLPVTINVTPIIDEPPVITTTQGNIPGASENSLFEYTLQFTDADVNGDSWVWSLQAKDHPDINIHPTNGTITWTPAEGTANGDEADYSFTARVTDSENNFDQATFTITVSADNNAPVINGKPIANANATEDVALMLNFSATDSDDPDTQTWTIRAPLVLPDNMAINNSGVFTWTPGEGINRTVAITLRVTDSTSLFDEVSFDINVTAVNDAPVIDVPIPDASVQEHSTYSYTLQVSDSDPLDNIPNLNSNLTFIITNISPTPNSTPPVINANGQITWTPGNNDARTVNPTALSQDYIISVSVADGGEDGALPATQSFTLTVTLLDSDGDTVPDYEDNCVNTPNTDQANNDGDALGDACDPDDDNDGISDIAEIFNGLDPFDPSDALLDLDGDGLSNLAEFNLCTGGDIYSPLTCENIQIDSVGPIITHNGDKNLVAAGYTTYVNFTANAIDGIDGVVPVSANIQNKHLRPGDHVITWTAQDAANNITLEEQHITIHPILSLGGSQVLAEGGSGEIHLQFNGDIPDADFPVSITFALSGTSSPADYLLSESSPIVINDASELINNTFIVDIDILDGDATEAQETLTITLTSVSAGPVLGNSRSHQIVIVDGQVVPQLALSAEQNAISTQFIFGDQGSVTVTANASDGNNDPLSYDWSSSDSELNGNAVNHTFSFDPSLLMIDAADMPRTFKVIAQVSDGFASVTQEMILVYMADTLVLSDSTDTDGDGIMDDMEGLFDSDGDGIPDYLDAYDNAANILFTGSSSGTGLPDFIESSPGTRLSLGQYALASQPMKPDLNMSLLASLDVDVTDEGFVHFGAIYEFVVSGLSAANRVAQVVIPLQQNIPPNAVYRKFDGNTWFNFVENANNRLSSASSNINGCPAPGSELYQPGLLAFRDCLQITLSDGGPNDIDGIANGTIVDPGGLALPEGADVLGGTQTEIDESSKFTANGPVSSGILSLWLLVALSILLLMAAYMNHKKAAAKV